MSKNFRTISILALLVPVGCVASHGESEADPTADVRGADQWDRGNNPEHFDSTFIYEVASLPMEGEAETPPIPSSYWPVYDEGVNVRWDGVDTLSPIEKFEKAFKRPGLAKAVGERYGIEAQDDRPTCITNKDCGDTTKDGTNADVVCAVARRDASKRCIPTWWGLCHGSARYSLGESPVVRPAVKNGITFFFRGYRGAYGACLPRCGARHQTRFRHV